MSLMPIIPSSQATAWRLDNTTADGVALDMTSGTSLGTFDVDHIEWKPDGTRLFASDTGGGNPDVYFWDCSTAWNLATAVYVSGIELAGFNFDEVRFNGDGTVVVGRYDQTLRSYSLSSPYGGTATYLNKTGNFGRAADSFFFNDDGSEIFYKGRNDTGLYKRPLSTAYDPSTLGAESLVKTLVDGRVTVSRFGTRLLVSDGSLITEYNGSAYNFSSFSQFQTLTVSGDEDLAVYAGDGTKLYVRDAATLTQYSTTG